MFSTVAANKESYSLAEVQGAEEARQLQALIGWPSDALFKDALTNPGTLYNCATTSDDVTRAHDITGGMAHQLLKGKSVRRKKRIFHDVPRININAPLLAKDRFDDLDADFMYVQGKPYLITLSLVKSSSKQCNLSTASVKSTRIIRKSPTGGAARISSKA